MFTNTNSLYTPFLKFSRTLFLKIVLFILHMLFLQITLKEVFETKQVKKEHCKHLFNTKSSHTTNKSFFKFSFLFVYINLGKKTNITRTHFCGRYSPPLV